jgi:hypothetical protein
MKRDGDKVPALFLSGIGELIGSIVLVCSPVLRGEWSQPFPLTTPVLARSRTWRCSGRSHLPDLLQPAKEAERDADGDDRVDDPADRGAAGDRL